MPDRTDRIYCCGRVAHITTRQTMRCPTCGAEWPHTIGTQPHHQPSRRI